MDRPRRPFQIAVLAGLVAIFAIAPPVHSQRQKTEYQFQGRVYEGEVGDQSTPIEGVTVTVYGSNNPHPDSGQLLLTTTTNSEGWWGLTVYDDDGFWEFYHIRETDPAGFESVNATTVDGIVRTPDWIEFEYPLEGHDLSGNKFWDRQPETPTPTPTPTATSSNTPTPTPTATSSDTPTPTSSPPSDDTPTPTPTSVPTLPPDCPELLANGDFELGELAPWGADGAVVLGGGFESEQGVQLGGSDDSHGELWQPVAIPENADDVVLALLWMAEGAEPQPGDRIDVLVQYSETADLIRTLAADEPLNEWRHLAIDLARYGGREIFISFLVYTDGEVPTTFRLDDISVKACGGTGSTPTPTPTSTPTSSPTPSSGLVSLCPVADTFINDGTPDTNYGAEQILEIGYGAGPGELHTRRALIRFDLSFIPQGTSVVNAHLEVDQTGAVGLTTVPVALYEIVDPWDENAVTWNNQPVVVTTPTTQTNVDSSQSVFAWNVRQLVQGWIDDPGANSGMELRGPESGSQWTRLFSSRQGTAFCPRLAIKLGQGSVFATATPTPTPTPTPTAQPVCPQPDAGGDDFAAASALTASTEVKEYICASGDVDWWKLPLESGQEVQVFLYDLPSGPPADLDVFLFDPSGAEKAGSAVYGAHKGGYINHTAWTTGDWRILVKGKGVADWSKTKTYSLRADTSYPCFSPDEAGDSFGQAASLTPGNPSLNLSRPVYGHICPQGDRDYYKFHVPGGQSTVRAELTELSANFDLRLWSPSGGSTWISTADGTTKEIIIQNASGLPGEWRIEVLGRNASTYHNQPYKLDVSVTSDVDLSVRGIEITQGIQDMKNSVPLIEGKPTWARVYLDIGNSTGPVGDVRLELHGWAFDNYGYQAPLPGSPLKLGPYTVDDPPAQLDTAQRLQLTEPSRILLPSTWVEAPGMIRLRADVNPDWRVPETDTTNNTLTVDSNTIYDKKPLKVTFVPIKAAGLTPKVAGSPVLDAMVTYLEATYPVPKVDVAVSKKPIVADYEYTKPVVDDCSEGWKGVLGDLSMFALFQKTFGSPHSFVYGFLHKDVPHKGHGCGRMGQPLAAGVFASYNTSTLAHEIGHNFGRLHAPCGAPAAGSDSGYPTYSSPQGTPYNSASIGEVGINLLSATPTPIDPKWTFDFMSYCTQDWISPYTFDSILIKLSNAKTVTAKDDGEPHVVVTGHIDDEGAELSPCWVLEVDVTDPGIPGDGPYAIQFRDADHVILSTHRFDPHVGCGSDQDDCGWFQHILPLAETTAEVVVLDDEDQQIASLSVSPAAPEVVVVQPNGGESWIGAGPFTVSWTMIDADGDPLTANLLYSADDGATWTPIATGADGQTVEVDGSALAGTPAGRIRIMVTDGFNTTTDDSDDVFSVSRKPPTLMLLRPTDGELLATTRQLLLHGLATDPEDGSLGGDSVVWSSDRDGLLGVGNNLVIDRLSCGTHRITATATDSDEMTDSHDVFVTALGGCSDNIYVIPAAAHTPGFEGTQWVTDMVLHNPASEAVEASIYLLLKNDSVRIGPSVMVPSGQSLKMIDVVGRSFGELEKSGALLVASSSGLLVTSRTYNDSADGTLGQYTPGRGEDEAVTGTLRSRLIQLSRTSRYRTNIGFANPTEHALALHVEVYDSSGSFLGRLNRTVNPWGHLQINDAIGKVTADDIPDGYAVVWSDDSRAAYFTYASTIDNSSGDPVHVAPIHSTDAAMYVMAAAHNPGVNQTLWRTDLEVCNPAGTEAEFRIDLLEANIDNSSPESTAFRLLAGTCRRYEDAVGLFDYEGSGALRVVPVTGGVSVTSRTYNDLGDATFGQYIPSSAVGFAIETGERARLVQLAQSPDRNTGYRTNVGFASASARSIDLTIDFFSGDGGYLGRKKLTVKPFSFKQLTEPIKKLTNDRIDDAFAVVWSNTDGARFFAYASVIDNLSGDPVYVPAAKW